MMDTNILEAVRATTGTAQSTFNAWHVVALLVGGVVIHVYHTIVNAGGYLVIWRRFKYGPTGAPGRDDALERLNAELAQTDSIKNKGGGGNATASRAPEPTAAPAQLPKDAVAATFRTPQ